MARRFAKRSKGSFVRSKNKMRGKSVGGRSKFRPRGGKRKFTKPNASFAKRVKTVLYKQVESKKIVCYIPSGAGPVPAFNLKAKQITFLGIDPNVSSTAAYNLLERRLGGPTTYFATVGGDLANSLATTARIYGDTVLGDEMMPTSIRIRGEFRNAIWAPPSRTMLMLIMGNAGDTPSVTTIWRNQLQNGFLDDFNSARYTLIASKTFALGGLVEAMNKNADEHKPGGTSSDYSTGTYWNAEGVTAVDDAQEATMVENTVKFNGAADMRCFAPKTKLIDWNVSLKRVGKVTYNGGTYGVSGSYSFNQPAVIPKQKALWLLAYNYSNNLQGTNEQNANVLVDELHWKLYFKDL